MTPIALAVSLIVGSNAGTDTFGIVQFLPTRPGTHSWNSKHWANGSARTIKYDSDTYDPTDWTDDHSGGTDGFYIDGRGTMRMSGSGPRFHINSSRTTGTGAQFFLNTEFTAYFRHSGTAGEAYGGLVVGARSGPLGHASGGGDDCDATTYYARFRDDGKWDFEKELKHPTSDYWSGGGFHTQDPLWGGALLPQKRWVGIKYLVWTLPDSQSVHLESWIDSVSGGDPANATWSKVGEVVDNGAWAAANGAISGCSYTSRYTVIQPGHGTFLLRTDGDTAEYKMVTLREIVPAPAALVQPRRAVPRQDKLRLEVLPRRLRDGGSGALQAVSPAGRRIPL